MLIPDKQCMYKLYEKNGFGNKPQVWSSYGEYIKSNFKNKIGIRYKIPNSPFCYIGSDYTNARQIIDGFISNGAIEEYFSLSEMIPIEGTLLQGELMLSPEGLELTYSKVKDVFRVSMKSSLRLVGLQANLLLKQTLYPSSYEDINTLLDLYPTSVIEFSAYSHPVGELPHRNTIVWEVRNY